jgi:hypothetical protein
MLPRVLVLFWLSASCTLATVTFCSIPGPACGLQVLETPVLVEDSDDDTAFGTAGSEDDDMWLDADLGGVWRLIMGAARNGASP